MVQNLIAAGALIVLVSSVWVALRFTDRWLGAPLRADLRSYVRAGVRHYRCGVELVVPEAFADLPWKERGRRPHTVRRRSLRILSASLTAANARSETSPAERQR